MKRYTLHLLVILAVVSAVCGGLLLSHNTFATIASDINSNCRNSGGAVGFAQYVSGVSFDKTNGVMRANLDIYVRRCNGTNTRAFAVTGYPSGNWILCPDAGSYAAGTVESPATYDCIKYTGTTPAGTPGFSCQYNNGRGASGRTCWTNDGWNNVRTTAGQPPSSGSTPYHLPTISISGTVPNWSNARFSTNSHTFSGQLCEYYSTGGGSSNNHFNVGCQNIRVTVSWKYWHLTPSVSAPPAKVYQTTSSITVTGKVQQSGSNPVENATWIFGRQIIPPGGGNPKAATQNSSAPNAYYGTGWTQISTGNGRSYPVSRTDTFTGLAGLPIGTKICWTMSVESWRPTWIVDQWSHTAATCTTVSAPPIMPMMQIQGYDGRFGGKVVTSLSQTYAGGASTAWGSWDEYGAFSTQQNYNFATAAGLVGGNSNVNQSAWSNLTAANTGNPCGANTFGCYGSINYPSVVDTLKNLCTNGPSGNIWQTQSGSTPVTVNASSPQLVCVHGTADIKSDLPYDYSSASLTNVASLPQKIIIADNIIIESTVKTINSWLVAADTQAGVSGATANGKMSTCSAVKSGTNYFLPFTSVTLSKGDTCKQPLSINGPVIANSLYLYRTTDPNKTGSPAETFTLGASTFLWAYGGGLSGSTIPLAQTISIQELPPRF